MGYLGRSASAVSQPRAPGDAGAFIDGAASASGIACLAAGPAQIAILRQNAILMPCCVGAAGFYRLYKFQQCHRVLLFITC